MADLQPLLTLRYDPSVVGPLEDVIAPPYDVIDAELRARLAARSPYNVVEIDLPESYEGAAATLADWRAKGALLDEEEPAVWALRQDYLAPDGERRRRTGVLARVRVEEYGPGRIRPHERTHPGPREDRLKLTRATRTNLSPSSACSATRTASPGARSSRSPVASRSPRRPTSTAPRTRSGARPTRTWWPSCRWRSRTPSC